MAMNKNEIGKAQKILAGRVNRFETIIDGNGQSLTAYWIDGGQKMFATLNDVEHFAENQRRHEEARRSSKITLETIED